MISPLPRGFVVEADNCLYVGNASYVCLATCYVYLATCYAFLATSYDLLEVFRHTQLRATIRIDVNYMSLMSIDNLDIRLMLVGRISEWQWVVGWSEKEEVMGIHS